MFDVRIALRRGVIGALTVLVLTVRDLTDWRAAAMQAVAGFLAGCLLDQEAFRTWLAQHQNGRGDS